MRILMINIPYSGHTNPTLPLAKLLVQRGHDVTYINAEEFRAVIEATGARFVPYINYPAAPGAQQKKMKCFRAAFDTALSLDEKFELLIYEMFFYPGIQIAKRLNIPCVRQFSQPAWCEDMIPSASAFLRLSLVLIDMQVMGRKNAAYMGLENKTLAGAVLKDEPDLNIVYVPEFFQKQREGFKANYLFTAPKPPKNGAAAKIAIPYNEMKRPIVYISLGSIISNRSFCKKCIRAFGGRELSVILNTGKVRPESLGELPSNIYAYSFVPQVEVLAHTQVFLTHCGMNSVNEAMLAGVPMAAMPFINDQISNAERITELGIGKRVPHFLCSAEQLYEAVIDISQDGEMKARCERVRELLRNGTTLQEAATRIESLA